MATPTVVNALKKSVNYPLTDEHVVPIVIARGIDEYAELNTSIANSKEYQLAYADVLRFVATMCNLSQGGSVNSANADTLKATANAIYQRFGEPLIGEADKPKVTMGYDFI